MGLAHGWPISIGLYVCQINRFMNSVAPNFTGLSFCAMHGSCSESCSLCYEIHVLLALLTKARILCLDSLESPVAEGIWVPR
jgi:hypothetical protein